MIEVLKYLTVGVFLSVICPDSGRFRCLTSDQTALLSQDSISLTGLLNRQWIYVHSLVKDTIVIVDNLGDLPRSLCFHQCVGHLTVDPMNPISSLILNNEFKGICATHEFLNVAISRPVIKRSKTSKQIRVTHYEVSGKAFVKAFDYFIMDLTADTLVLENERYYNIGGRNVLLKHVFAKQKDLIKSRCK